MRYRMRWHGKGALALNEMIDKSTKFAVSVKSAVQVSGIGRSKLYEAMNTGKLPARKLGTRTIILLDDLKAYLDELPPYRG